MQCDCGKKLLATFAVFIFKIVSGMILCGGIFKWVYTLPPTSVWRPMGPSKRLFLGLFLMSFIFVLVYKIVGKAFEGMGTVKKGLVYGLCVWAVGLLSGMIATYVFIAVNTTVVIYWTLNGLVLMPIEGIIVAAILRNSTEACCIKK